MIKLRFNNRHDEIKFFLRIKDIQECLDIKIPYADCVYDEEFYPRVSEEDEEDI